MTAPVLPDGVDLGALEGVLSRQPDDPDALERYHRAISADGLARRGSHFLGALTRTAPGNKSLAYLHIELLLRQGRDAEALDAVESAMARFGLQDGILAPALALRRRVGPPVRDPAAPDAIGLCMIVRDEAAMLARCLQSVKAVVAEMVVVDTGSRDRSTDVARVFGARVSHFAWCDDFSAARNFGLDQARSPWILILDADEVIAAGDLPGLAALTRLETDVPARAYSFQTRNYIRQSHVVGWQPNDGRYPDEAAGCGWVGTDKVRLFPNRPGIRFAAPVHELVDGALKRAGVAICPSPVPVHHYGTLDETHAQAKGERYYRIGLKKLESGGDDPSALRELALQAAVLGRPAEALGLWRRLLAAEPDADRRAEAWIHVSSLLWAAGRYAEALPAARQAMALVPSGKEARYNAALAELTGGSLAEARRLAAGLAQSEPDYAPGRFVAAVVAAVCGDPVRAAGQLAELRTSAMGPQLADTTREMIRRLADCGRPTAGLARAMAGLAAESEGSGP